MFNAIEAFLAVFGALPDEASAAEMQSPAADEKSAKLKGGDMISLAINLKNALACAQKAEADIEKFATIAEEALRMHGNGERAEGYDQAMKSVLEHFSFRIIPAQLLRVVRDDQ